MRSIINEKNLNNKKILLRLDLNVPLERDKITDTTRIDKILPTLNFLIKEKAKIIILSHVGRPKGKIVEELSLKPVCEELQNKLRKKVKLISENIKEIKSKNFFNEYNEDIFILENIRFYSEEENNDTNFAKNKKEFLLLLSGKIERCFFLSVIATPTEYIILLTLQKD